MKDLLMVTSRLLHATVQPEWEDTGGRKTRSEKYIILLPQLSFEKALLPFTDKHFDTSFLKITGEVEVWGGGLEQNDFKGIQ